MVRYSAEETIGYFRIAGDRMYVRGSGVKDPTNAELSAQLDQIVASRKIEHIQRLELSNLRLRTLPESIGSFTNLQTLDVSRNQLQSLPDSICRLRNLQNLKLQFNDLAVLPDCLGDLQKLRYL